MTLDDEDVEAIAARVVELLAARPARRYVDAAELARMLDLSRDWVYAHATRLGALRLDRGALRFDPEYVARVMRDDAPAAAPTRRRSRPAARARQTVTYDLIPYERS